MEGGEELGGHRLPGAVGEGEGAGDHGQILIPGVLRGDKHLRPSRAAAGAVRRDRKDDTAGRRPDEMGLAVFHTHILFFDKVRFLINSNRPRGAGAAPALGPAGNTNRRRRVSNLNTALKEESTRTHDYYTYFLLQTARKIGIIIPWCNYVAVLSDSSTRTGP